MRIFSTKRRYDKVILIRVIINLGDRQNW